MKNVEDLYPLTPMQRTMLLHALTAGGADKLFHQFRYEIRGPIDVSALNVAWQRVTTRHPSLRTAFVWQDRQDPLQVVRQTVTMPFAELDWRSLGAAEQEARLERWTEEDRAAGFDLAKAPLMRITVFRITDDTAWMVWSSHHLILDRWCVGIVLADLADGYAQTADQQAPGRFRDYVQWIQDRDAEAARTWWREALRGVDGATRTLLAAGGAPDPTAALALDDTATTALRAAARRHQVTPNILCQGAWALLMNELAHGADVVFGTTVAGRPPEVPGIETTVGSFISNLPVRVRLAPETSVGSWLAAMHTHQQQRAGHEWVATADVHAASGLTAGDPLFDSLLVWLAPVPPVAPRGVEFVGVDGAVDTTWPVTVSFAEEAKGLRISVRCTAGHDAAALLRCFERKLQAILENPDAQLGDFAGFVRTGATAPAADPGEAASSHLAPPSAATTQAQGREEDELESIQQILLAESRAALQNDAIQLSDNFFAAGGDSIRAAHIHTQLERITGRSIPQMSLFEAPDLGAMARFLTQRQWPLREERVRVLQPRGSKPPLFCIASPEVNSIGYVLMARHLGPEQPVYMIQSPPGSDEILRMAITQIPDLTKDYITAVRDIQPHGPYRLIGMCGGALIAHEMAKIITKAGDRVEFLGVLNTYALYTLSPLYHVRRAENRLRYYAGRIAAFHRLDWNHKRFEIRRVLKRRLSTVSSAVRGGSEAPGEPAEPVAPAAPQSDPARHTLESVAREWEKLDWPAHEPAEPKYPGTVTVFRIRRQPYFRIRDEALGWGNHAAAVDVIHLETEVHLDILREPHVRNTAAAITACLEGTEGGSA